MRQTVLAGVATQLLYDGTDLVAEYDAAGTLLRRYVHGSGLDEPLVVYDGAGAATKSWLYADHLGSVILQANAAGSGTAVYRYGPFGEPDVATGVRFRYTGQQYLGALGLYHYKARFYSPTLGRFLQTDPIGTADDTNLYAYVGNNPVNLADPSGLAAAEARMLAGRLGDWGARNGTAILDGAQTGLDVAGLVPGFGEVADGANALIYLARGDRVNAGLSAAAMIPVFGPMATAGKLATKGGDALQTILHAKSMRGNFNVGSMARSQMDEVGNSWVGPNAKAMMKGDTQIGWTSADGLKTYRFPQLKENGLAAGRTQANLTEFLRLDNGQTQILRNAHIDLLP